MLGETHKSPILGTTVNIEAKGKYKAVALIVLAKNI